MPTQIKPRKRLPPLCYFIFYTGHRAQNERRPASDFVHPAPELGIRVADSLAEALDRMAREIWPVELLGVRPSIWLAGGDGFVEYNGSILCAVEVTRAYRGSDMVTPWAPDPDAGNTPPWSRGTR